MNHIPTLLRLPSKLNLNPSPQLRSNLHMSNISWMPSSGPNVIVLEDSLGIKQVDIIAASASLKAVDKLRNLSWPPGSSDVSFSGLTEAKVERHDNDVSAGPDAVDLIDHLGVGRKKLGLCDVIVGVCVVGTDVDDDDVGGLLLLKVPWLGREAVELLLAPVAVLSLLPLEDLSAGVAPAVFVGDADAGVGGNGVFDVAETGGEEVGP